MNEDMLYTTVVHAGEDPKGNLGSLSVPIYQSAVFTFPDAEQGAAIHEGEQPGYFYGRMGNPTMIRILCNPSWRMKQHAARQGFHISRHRC